MRDKLSTINFESFLKHYRPTHPSSKVYHLNSKNADKRLVRKEKPGIMDSRYDSSPWTWWYRKHPGVYNHERHHHSNSRLFGYPHWFDHFTNPNSENVYLIVILILLILCYVLR